MILISMIAMRMSQVMNLIFRLREYLYRYVIFSVFTHHIFLLSFVSRSLHGKPFTRILYMKHV